MANTQKKMQKIEEVLQKATTKHLGGEYHNSHFSASVREYLQDGTLEFVTVDASIYVFGVQL